jgi:hypothetical protein
MAQNNKVYGGSSLSLAYRTVISRAEVLTSLYRFHHFLAGVEPNNPDSVAACQKFVYLTRIFLLPNGI